MYAINPQTYPQKLWVSFVACLGILSLTSPTAVLAGETPARGTATAFLTVDAQVDGKCQNLSEGGKLVILHNTHPARSIEYRLVRMFAKVPQSRVVGVLAPDGEGQRLGCNRVDGREQSWRVERATFEKENP